MFTHHKSLKVVVPQKFGFIPPYCPNHKCPFHDPSQSFRYHRHGSIKIKRFPYVSPRFRCTECKRAFTSSFFSLSYRDKAEDLYSEIFFLRHGGASKRRIAKGLGLSTSAVLRKISKISEFGLLVMAKDLEKLKIKESIAFDGLENFAFSQYDPNVINHAIGRESLFTYDFNFCHLNRKGRMTSRQKERKLSLEKKYGKYPGQAQRHCAGRIFRRLLAKSGAPLTLHSDDHFMYREAIKDIGATRLIHEVTSPS
jgi:transposase-like protein